ncbi:hypothetical protein CRUP_017800 [Coryphaenoides rupestris]|nr:hypothetical protein CRUP_017800 [Coryphaenoides rupestris]
MPLLTPTTVLQIALLLSAIPAQYLISRWSGATVTQRYHATTRSLVGLGDEEPSPEDSASPEMWMFDNEHGYFGASRAARSPRPPFVFLRVGAVVRERNGHMVGVVVGWDAERRAPEEWVNRVYPNQELEIPTLEQYFTHFNGRQFRRIEAK